MLIECVYPSGEKIKLKLEKDNYLLPLNSVIEISAMNDDVYVDGLLLKDNKFSYQGLDLLIESSMEKCRIIGLSDIMPENFKIEYNGFANALKNNYVGGEIDEQLLFSALGVNDEDYGINLCTFNRQIEELTVDKRLSEINKYISNVTSIFYRPKMHLKSYNEVRPIDTVTRIGNEAIKHLACHSEHWESRKATGLVPARLLAKFLEDDTSIYENKAAKCLVDKIYKYVKEARDKLQDIIGQMPYEEGNISYNSEQKNYFHARDKLQRGYESDNIQVAKLLLKDQLDEVNHILNKLYECKDTLLYRELKRTKPITGQLKLTNILMMDNNYKYVYKLWPLVFRAEDTKSVIEHKSISDEYELFCQTLFLFALKYFNFINIKGENANIFANGNFIGGEYYFSNWNLTVKSINIPEIGTEGILVTVSKKIAYEIDTKGMVLPSPKDAVEFEYITILQDKLVFSKIPTEKEINDFAKLNRKSANGDKNKEKRLFGELKTLISESFNSYNHKVNKIMLIPLSFKFIDSSICIKTCIEELDNQLVNCIKKNEVAAYYYLTPFRPNDYSEKESASQLSDILDYGYANEIKRRNSSKIIKGVLPITISDINSYRRLTKIILMQMVDVDNEYSHCPICGEEFIEERNSRHCRNCEFKIFKTKCNKCGEEYAFTDYKKPKTSIIGGDTANLRMLINESAEGFKNITEIDEKTKKHRCSYCGEIQ